MKNLLDIKGRLVNFYDLEEEEGELLIKEIQRYAETKEVYELADEIRSNFELKEFSGIGIIYEALSEDQGKWASFFKEEYERAFSLAIRSEKAYEILTCLDEIYNTDEMDSSNMKSIVHFLESHLSHQKDVIRYKAIWYLGSFIFEDNKFQFPDIIRKVKDRLKDDSWKVRYIAHSTLKDLEALPKGFKLGFLDRMRIKYSNPFLFD